MDVFFAYSIPIQGLKVGIHSYRYALDREFFSHFEGSPIGTADVACNLTLDKRPDMLVLDFEMGGWIEAECDRCTALIHLPLQAERQLLVKYGEQEGETEDEVVFIPRESSSFNVAKYLYEFAVLAMPITNTYACEEDDPRPCNQEILKYLSNESAANENGSVWDTLKDLNKN